MLSLERIQKARDAGYDDDAIVSSIERNDPEFAKRIKKAREAGYDSSTILGSIFRNHGKSKAGNESTVSQPASQNTYIGFNDDKNVISNTQKPQEINQSNVKPLYMENSVMERLDPVSQRLRESGYEPDVSEEFERLSQGGTREVLKTLLSLGHAGDPEVKENLSELAKGAASGATLGLSEYVPGLETKGNLASGIGEFAGETIPISGLSKLFVKPLVNIAKKSPKYKTALESFARLTGMTALGTVYGGAKDVIKTGEMPTREDLLKHGAS